MCRSELSPDSGAYNHSSFTPVCTLLNTDALFDYFFTDQRSGRYYCSPGYPLQLTLPPCLQISVEKNPEFADWQPDQQKSCLFSWPGALAMNRNKQLHRQQKR
jgi:hypothetical protein